MRQLTIFACFAVLLSACGSGSRNRGAAANMANLSAEPQVLNDAALSPNAAAPKTKSKISPSVAEVPDLAAETPYPSDPNARFRILSVKRLRNGNIEVLNRRDGPSGTSYSRREISCSAYTFRYLGEGDTLEQAKEDGPNPGRMAPLTGTSASSDVADTACAGR